MQLAVGWLSTPCSLRTAVESRPVSLQRFASSARSQSHASPLSERASERERARKSIMRESWHLIAAQRCGWRTELHNVALRDAIRVLQESIIAIEHLHVGKVGISNANDHDRQGERRGFDYGIDRVRQVCRVSHHQSHAGGRARVRHPSLKLRHHHMYVCMSSKCSRPEISPSVMMSSIRYRWCSCDTSLPTIDAAVLMSYSTRQHGEQERPQHEDLRPTTDDRRLNTVPVQSSLVPTGRRLQVHVGTPPECRRFLRLRAIITCQIQSERERERERPRETARTLGANVSGKQ